LNSVPTHLKLVRCQSPGNAKLSLVMTENQRMCSTLLSLVTLLHQSFSLTTHNLSLNTYGRRVYQHPQSPATWWLLIWDPLPLQSILRLTHHSLALQKSWHLRRTPKRQSRSILIQVWSRIVSVIISMVNWQSVMMVIPTRTLLHLRVRSASLTCRSCHQRSTLVAS